MHVDGVGCCTRENTGAKGTLVLADCKMWIDVRTMPANDSVGNKLVSIFYERPSQSHVTKQNHGHITSEQ